VQWCLVNFGEPIVHLFSSVAHVWVYLEQKLLGRLWKRLFFLKSNFYVSENFKFQCDPFSNKKDVSQRSSCMPPMGPVRNGIFSLDRRSWNCVHTIYSERTQKKEKKKLRETYLIQRGRQRSNIIRVRAPKTLYSQKTATRQTFVTCREIQSCVLQHFSNLTSITVIVKKCNVIFSLGKPWWAYMYSNFVIYFVTFHQTF
jgi:hypothetical protein